MRILELILDKLNAKSVLDSDLSMTQDEINKRTMGSVGYSGAGAHNAVYRGENLGNYVTSEQYDAIDSGTFDGLYIGDYWEIDGRKWFVAAFDYWLKTGDTQTQVNNIPHHIAIVPEESLYVAQMNNTESGQYSPSAAENDASGAYAGSDMYLQNLDEAKGIINSAFGEGHILRHREFFVNDIHGTAISAGAWYDSTVDLMNECQAIGARFYSGGSMAPTVDKCQFPLFAMNHSLLSYHGGTWLRDVQDEHSFSAIDLTGTINAVWATRPYGVRPCFGICKIQANIEVGG